MRAAPDHTPMLPETADALRALLLAAWAERDSAVAERDALASQNDRLRHLLLRLKRLQFGATSERLPEEQRQLGLADLEQAIAQGEAEGEKHDPALKRERTAKRRASRGALPAHLPRVEVTLMPEDTACPCCRGVMAVIGHDSAERLDVAPAQFQVLVTRRPKLACRACEGVVVQAPAPARLIEGGLPTEALVAHVLVARHADHLPLYRQAQIMARQGAELERPTLAFWVGYAAAEVAPVVSRLRGILLCSARVFADETVVPALDPGRGRTKQGYFWAVARDDRPWGGADPPAVVCSYAPGRGQEHNDRLLGGYRGILQCDGYATYKKLAGPKDDGGAVTLVFCWSHVRRGFLRPGQGRRGPGRDRGAGAHRRPLPDRSRGARQNGRGPARRAPGQEPAAGRGPARLVRGAGGDAAGAGSDCRRDPLRAEPLGRPGTVPRRRAHRT